MGLIRCLLALAVVLSHTTPIFGVRLVDGSLAVQAFYMISGFYMTLILNEKYLPENSTYGLFLRSRLLRLFPIYWLVLTATLIVQGLWPATIPPREEILGSLGYWKEYASTLSPLSLLYLGLTNVFLIGQDSLMYLKLNLPTGSLAYAGPPNAEAVHAFRFLLVPQAWTLAIELMFYLLAPFLVRRSVKTLLVLIGLSVALRLVLRFQFGLTYDPWNYRFFPTELAFFLIGAVGYRAYRFLRASDGFKPAYSRAAFAAAVGFILLYNAPLLAGLPAKKGVFLLVMAAAFPMIFLLTKNDRRDRYIGDLSYPIYITHVLIMEILRVWGWNTGLITFGATLLVSLLLLEGVDRPVERFRQRMFERQKKLEAAPERIAIP
ncbi:MAG: acyltransferase [Armatimonadetes bacterium]|nr:acyltransferase [Armatimonadota bacterium]